VARVTDSNESKEKEVMSYERGKKMLVANEGILADSNIRKRLEVLACKMVKAGIRIPSSDYLLSLARELDGPGEIELDSPEHMMIGAIAVGVMYLHQLALAKERM
jgi:hypothetical protein